MTGYETLDALNHEVARIEKLLTKPGFKYPNLAAIRLGALKRGRLRFTFPVIYKLRVVVSGWFQTLANWIAP